MKQGLRQSMAWLHTWSGLLVGWVLYFIFLTGTIGYFDAEIDRWMQPELPLNSAQIEPERAIAQGIARLQQVAPGAERWRVELPNRNIGAEFRVSWRMPATAGGAFATSGNELLDPAAGQPVEPRRTGGGQLLYQMHYRLHYLNSQDAYWIVGFCTMFMLVGILSGVITHKKIFKDFFTFRRGKGQRSWLDAHNALSVLALPFHIMITYSGLVFFMFTYMPMVLDEVYGFDEASQAEFFDYAYPGAPDLPPAGIAKPLTPVGPLLTREGSGRLLSVTVRNPGDANARVIVMRERNNPQSGAEQIVFDGVTGTLLDAQGPPRFAARKVNDALIGLHEGLFAGPLLRWLYFLSGLLGTAMIATGLVLWTVKRRAQPPADAISAAGRYLVERLNAGTIVGLPIGIAAYFWANRLLPVDFQARGMWEAHVMFAAWALALFYPVFRPVMRAWMELLIVAAAMYLLLPLVNAATTQRHLGMTLAHGDWGLAGFDLTMLGVALAFAVAALKVRRKIERSAVAPAADPLAPSLPLPAEALK